MQRWRGGAVRQVADRVSHDLSAAAEKRRGFSRKLIMQNGAETKMFPLRFGRGDGTCKEPRSGDGIAIGAKAAGKSGAAGRRSRQP